MDAHVFERGGDVVAGPHDIPDVEAGRRLHIDAGGPVGRWPVVRIRTKARIANGLKALTELLSVVFRDGGDDVRLWLDLLRRDLEGKVLILTLAHGRELCNR